MICSLVEPGGERSMAADRGAAAGLRAEELEAEWLAGCNHLYVSGYALMREPARGAAAQASRSPVPPARRSASISLLGAIRDVGPECFRTVVEDVALRTCSPTRTRRASSAARSPERHGSSSTARAAAFDGDERAALPVEEVVDSTGAEAPLAAGFIVGEPDLALERLRDASPG